MTRFLGWVRDILALLYTPILTGLAVWLIWSFMYGPWSPQSETLRLTALGFTLGGYVVLQGLGGLWLQRRGIDSVKVQGPGGSSVEIGTEADGGA
jgi:hypothetical protein